METHAGKMPFREWALISAYFRSPEPDFLPRGFTFAPDVAIRFVLSEAGPERAHAKKILEALDPLETFDRALLLHMMSDPELIPLVPRLFAEVMDEMSSDELLRLSASPSTDFSHLLWRISTTSNPMHRPFHVEAIARVLGKPIDLHHFRYVGSMLRSYPGDDIKDMLEDGPLVDRSDKVLWLIRMIEEARRERLIDEAGDTLP